jgi:hypothetical protein
MYRQRRHKNSKKLQDQKAGYRISGRISGKGQIPDIRPDIPPDTWVDKHILGKISNKFVKTIIAFCKHQMKYDLETKLIFVQIFFLALFEEKLYKLFDQLNISRISGIRPYWISGRAIWYPAGYRISKRPDYPVGRISGASLV